MKYMRETPWGSLFWLPGFKVYSERRLNAAYLRIGPLLFIKAHKSL